MTTFDWEGRKRAESVTKPRPDVGAVVTSGLTPAELKKLRNQGSGGKFVPRSQRMTVQQRRALYR